MADDVLDRVGRAQRPGQPVERPVLSNREAQAIGPFQLDADGKVVTAGYPAPAGHPRVPSPQLAGNELDDPATAADEEMGGDLEVPQPLVVRVGVRVKAVGEQADDPVPAKLSGGQADVMYNQQPYPGTGRPLVAVGRGDEGDTGDQPMRADGKG